MIDLALNGLTFPEFLEAWFFCVLGFAFHKLTVALFRDRKSQRTPATFSWSFWFRDNWKEAVWHIMLMYFGVLFSPWIWDKLTQSDFFPDTFKQWTVDIPHVGVSIILGWLVAMPIQWWKKKGKAVASKLKR